MKKKVWDITVKDNPNRVVMGENDEFYTTDTEAYLVFILEDEDFSPPTAWLTLENRNDGSIKDEEVEVIDGKIEWEMPKRYIEHSGNWQAQLIYEQMKDGVLESYTSDTATFVVKSHIKDKKKPSLVEIENWEKFIREGTELIETWENLEALREENERQRQENYQELLDTGVLQTNINEKLEDLEGQYAPKLTEVTTQLAQKVTKNIVDTIPNDLSIYPENSIILIKENPFWKDDFKGTYIDDDKWNVIGGDSFITQNDKLSLVTTSSFSDLAGFHSKKGFYRNVNGKLTLRIKESDSYTQNQALAELYQSTVNSVTDTTYWDELVFHLNKASGRIWVSLVDRNGTRKYWDNINKGWTDAITSLSPFPYVSGDVLRYSIIMDAVGNAVRFEVINETQNTTIKTGDFPISDLRRGGNIIYPHNLDTSTESTKSLSWLDIKYGGDI